MEGPNKEFADPERIELMEQFAQEYYEIYRYKEIPQSTYAFLWLSDIERLRELVENPRLTNNQDERETILRCSYRYLA